MQIRPRKALAAVAITRRIDGAQILFILGVANLDIAVTRKKPAVTGVARRHNAVKHIDAAAHTRQDLPGFRLPSDIGVYFAAYSEQPHP